MKTHMTWVLAWSLAAGAAAAAEDALHTVIREQAALEKVLQGLEDQEQQASQACWQRFAVNDCLIRVRREARRQREPLQNQWLALRDREREIRLQQRELRLQGKATAHD